MDIINQLAAELQIRKEQADAAVQLIDEGNTIPFIARYRKEATGALDDETLRNLHERLQYLRNLEEKKTQVLQSIEEQGKLDAGASQKDRGGCDAGGCGRPVSSVPPEETDPRHDCQGKRSGASCQHHSSSEDRKNYRGGSARVCGSGKGVETVQDAIAGSCDIIAEQVADRSDYGRAFGSGR